MKFLQVILKQKSCRLFKGTLMQISRSTNIFVFIKNNMLKISH